MLKPVSQILKNQSNGQQNQKNDYPNTQQYPGQFANKTLEEVQRFNRRDAYKVRGYTIPCAANATTPENLQISGMAWMLCGIQAHAPEQFDDDAAMPISITLTINQEKVIDRLPWTLIDVKYMNNWYFPFERYLSGSDEVILQIENGGTQQDIAFSCIYR